MTGKYLAEKHIKGYLTVYLALILTIILSLCLTLIEGTRQNGIYMEAECIADIGLNSVFAEYHRELFKQYNLFAIDSSYGTALPQVDNVNQHLSQYIERNLARDDICLDWLLYRDFLGMQLDGTGIVEARMLTDDEGGVFRKRAADAMKDNLNIQLLQEVMEWMEVVEAEEMAERGIAEEKKKLDQQLKKYDGQEKQISETEWITIEVKNPTAYLEKMRKEGILKWVIKEPDKLSTKYLEDDNLISFRMKADRYNKGNMEWEQETEWEDFSERFLFQEYLLQYMGYYGKEIEEHTLAYQIEYLLMGDKADLENLRGVVNRIFAMREVANVSYLLSDQEKCGAAEAMGSLLATAMTIPEAAGLIKYILLFGWAFAESIYDVQCLMEGEQVPLMKDSSTWHFDLKAAMKFGVSEKKEVTNGLFYVDYLRILMCLEKNDILTSRAMDMVEADIRGTPYNSQFRLDGCLDAIAADIKIKSVYGYDCEIIRERSYIPQ